MSYARFGDGDVYVFTSRQGIECCFCALVPRHWETNDKSFFGGYMVPDVPGEDDLVTRDHTEMVAHLMRHREAGHEVPQDAIDRLNDPEDQAENAAIWAKYDAADIA